jgi:hypothetical protein
VLLIGWVCGCGEAPPVGTGAEAVAQAYCEALLRQDWVSAYGALDPASKGAVRSDQFPPLARERWQRADFEPEGVQVRACEERGNEATAHVIFRGRAKGRPRFYRDAVTLRRSGERWAVVLPQALGQSR